MERKEAGHRQWWVNPRSHSMKCVGCRVGITVGDRVGMSGQPDDHKRPNSFEGDREPWKVLKRESDMTLTHSIEQTFIKARMVSHAECPLSSPPPTHTLSMSMRLLCLRFPSWSNRAFSSLICSASSGFKSNSAGNAEIQYLMDARHNPVT